MARPCAPERSGPRAATDRCAPGSGVVDRRLDEQVGADAAPRPGRNTTKGDDQPAHQPRAGGLPAPRPALRRQRRRTPPRPGAGTPRPWSEAGDLVVLRARRQRIATSTPRLACRAMPLISARRRLRWRPPSSPRTSRPWSSAPGPSASRTSPTRPTCARSSTPSPAGAPRTAGSAPSPLRRVRDAPARHDGARADPRARAAARRREPTASAWSPRGQGEQARFRQGPCGARAWWPSTPTSSAAPPWGTCRSIARSLREAGIQRVHHNVETARQLLPRGLDHGALRGPIRTISREGAGWRRASRDPQLGETPEAARGDGLRALRDRPGLGPHQSPQPRPGTKFGDRD